MTKLDKMRQEIVDAQLKKEQMEHQVIRAQNRLNNVRRKKDKQRTHRLIVEGAELEYVFEGIEHMPQQTFWDFMHALVKIPGVMELFEKMKRACGRSDEEGGET